MSDISSASHAELSMLQTVSSILFSKESTPIWLSLTILGIKVHSLFKLYYNSEKLSSSTLHKPKAITGTIGSASSVAASVVETQLCSIEESQKIFFPLFIAASFLTFVEQLEPIQCKEKPQEQEQSQKVTLREKQLKDRKKAAQYASTTDLVSSLLTLGAIINGLKESETACLTTKVISSLGAVARNFFSIYNLGKKINDDQIFFTLILDKITENGLIKNDN